MLFSEIYGCYFTAVAAVLREAARGALTDSRLTALVREKAFAESTLTIPAALKKQTWPLLGAGLRPVLRHAPTMPLTLLEKRWLKALLGDARIALFEPDTAGLEGVEPLWAPGTFVLFDRCADGDPYTDETYIACFRTVLRALREKRAVRITFRDAHGVRHRLEGVPLHLEYSAKDDKFRLLAVQDRRLHTVNLARMERCELCAPADGARPCAAAPRMAELTLRLVDERGALERVLLHFSHFEKETVRLGGREYELRLRYDRADEAEMLIRVLSFGPVVRVVAPAPFARQVRERLARQRALRAPGGGRKVITD